jgi:hypothetical protein
MTDAPEQLQNVHSAAAEALPPSALLRDKLDGLRRRHVLVAVFTGIAMTAVVSIELLALAMFMDWWLNLPWAVRLISFVAQLGVFTVILARQVVLPILRQPD